MVPAFIGIGTTVNVLGIILGSSIGVLLSGKFSSSTRSLITDVLGLCTGVIGAMSMAPLFQPTLGEAVGESFAFILIVLCMVVGTIIGANLRIERRLDLLGDALIEFTNKRAGRQTDADSKTRFTQGFVTASLLFCVGPLIVLGSLSEGLGLGSEQLFTKSLLDFFASIAFASSLGWGVMASALTVAVLQGSLTLLGVWLGDFLSAAQVDALSIAGGIMLIGLAIRLLDLKKIRVADMTPALVLAPLAVFLVQLIR